MKPYDKKTVLKALKEGKKPKELIAEGYSSYLLYSDRNAHFVSKLPRFTEEEFLQELEELFNYTKIHRGNNGRFKNKRNNDARS